MIKSDIRTYDLRAVRRKVDKLTAELGKAKVKISKASLNLWIDSNFYLMDQFLFLTFYICLSLCLICHPVFNSVISLISLLIRLSDVSALAPTGLSSTLSPPQTASGLSMQRCQTFVTFSKVKILTFSCKAISHLIHQESMYYLEDISAGKLLVLEHGRREGVDGGPEIVVEKEDTKDTVRTQTI